ncbi:MAG: hypothetical protein ACFB51_01915 [Anaerolineae bacterium]
MSYTITRRDDLPVLISEVSTDFDPRSDLQPLLAELDAAFAAMDGPFYYIANIGESKWNFAQVVQALGQVAGSNAAMLLRNPHLRETLVVVHSDLIELGVRALSQTQYGGLRAHLMDSVEEALAYVRKDVSSP